jgi:hypothetical protein
MTREQKRITRNRLGSILAAIAALAGTAYWVSSSSAETAHMVPPPVMDESTPNASTEVAVLAGGCFWGSRASSSMSTE